MGGGGEVGGTGEPPYYICDQINGYCEHVYMRVNQQ